MGVPQVRLRQVVLVTRDLPGVERALRDDLGLDEPYVDPGVAAFGVENRVFAAGDCFVEALGLLPGPAGADSAAARHLARHGGDAGYMSIFQFADLGAARARARDLGVRVVWQADLPEAGVAGTHLHPRDVPGAIVSLDAADPPESWHWAGPAWTGGAPPGATGSGGITSLTVSVPDPVAAAARWAEVLGVPAAGHTISLADAGQSLRFEEGHAEAITAWALRLPSARPRSFDLGGVRFDVHG
jgi:hypothetical protein